MRSAALTRTHTRTAFASISAGFHVLFPTADSHLSHTQGRRRRRLLSASLLDCPPAPAEKARHRHSRSRRDARGYRQGPSRTPAGGTAPRAAALAPLRSLPPLTEERRAGGDPPLPSPRSPRHTKSTDFTSPAAIFARGRTATQGGDLPACRAARASLYGAGRGSRLQFLPDLRKKGEL